MKSPASRCSKRASSGRFGQLDLNPAQGSTAYPLFATWRRGLRQGVLGFNPTNPPPPTTDFTPAQEAEASRAMVVGL